MNCLRRLAAQLGVPPRCCQSKPDYGRRSPSVEENVLSSPSRSLAAKIVLVHFDVKLTYFAVVENVVHETFRRKTVG